MTKDIQQSYEELIESKKIETGTLYDNCIPIFIIVGLVLFFLVMFIIYKLIRSPRVPPITKSPIIPFRQEFVTIEETDEVQSLVGYAKWDMNRKPSSEELETKIKELSHIYNFHTFSQIIEIVSIRMDGFKHGIRCHDFIPNDGSAKGSSYMYQTFGDNNIQFTYYVKDGVSYVAGFCIYVNSNGSVCFSLEVIENMLKYPKYASEQLIRKEENKKRNNSDNEQKKSFRHQEDLLVSTENWSVKNCSRLQRDIMSTTKDGSIYHQEWNTFLNRMTNHPCVDCSKDLIQDSPPTYSSLSNRR